MITFISKRPRQECILKLVFNSWVNKTRRKNKHLLKVLFFTRCFFLYPNFAKMSFLEKRGPPRAWELKRLFCGVFEYLETSSGSKKLPCRAVWQARLPRTSNRLQNNYSRDFWYFSDSQSSRLPKRASRRVSGMPGALKIPKNHTKISASTPRHVVRLIFLQNHFCKIRV